MQIGLVQERRRNWMVGRICPRRGHLGELLLICLKGCTYGDTLLLLICGERMLSLLLGFFVQRIVVLIQWGVMECRWMMMRMLLELVFGR